MRDDGRKQEYPRRTRHAYAIIGVSAIVGLFAAPLLGGQRYNPSVILISLLATVLALLGATALSRRFGYDGVAAFAAQPRQPGETRWEWYRRIYTAPPRHRPIYRLFVVLGTVSIAESLILFVTNRLPALVNLALGVAMVLIGGAEFFPSGRRRGATVARLTGLAVMVVGFVLLWSDLLRR